MRGQSGGMWGSQDWENSVIDSITPADVYPTSGSMSTMEVAQPGSDMYAAMAAGDWGASDAGGLSDQGNNAPIPTSDGGSAPVSGGRAAAGGASGGWVTKPLAGVLVIAVLTVGIIVLAHKTGKTEEFSSIRGSAYNIFFVTLVAMVGFLVLKVVASKVNIPGISAAIKAA
jgi:hypothetical protein